MRRFGNKFGNKRTTVDGIAFASKAEATRYLELRLLEKAGKVIELKLQPRYRLEVNGQKICDYVADFLYIEWVDPQTPKTRVEDVKGFRTPEYELKRKLMLACHGIEIQEIGGNRRKATKKLANAKPPRKANP